MRIVQAKSQNVSGPPVIFDADRVVWVGWYYETTTDSGVRLMFDMGATMDIRCGGYGIPSEIKEKLIQYYQEMVWPSDRI